MMKPEQDHVEGDQNGRRPKWKTTKMEDDQNGRRPKWKTTKMKDDQNGRRPKWKTTKMEDDQNGRRPKWKMTKTEDDQNGRRPKPKDDQNGRRPKWKTTKMEDDQNGRRSKWKTTKMEDDQNGRQPKWKTTKMEYDQDERRPKWKMTKMEDDQNGRRPKWKKKKKSVECIKKWGNLYGMPFKCVVDGGPGFRDDFKTQLTQLNIRVVPSSCYHSQSNSLAERAVQSVKNCLKKSAEWFTKLHLMEMVFAINTTESSEGTGSPAMRLFDRALQTNLPNSIGPEIDSKELIRKRIIRHDARIKKKSFKNKILYEVGDRVRLQNVKDKTWGLIGTVERRRTADDGQILSYDILTDKEFYS